MTTKIDFDRYAKDLEGKTVLITGGTGSFGSAVVEALLGLSVTRVVVFSRDEKKQFDMSNRFNDPKLQFIIGDVRDRETVDRAMEGVDYVFHAAALKQVPTGEFFPMELVKTNVLGSHNVLHSAIDHGVKRVVVLSTDKACAPINVMGMTKALMERVMVAAAHRGKEKTVVCGTRYGNVLYSRGSIVPYLVERIKSGKSLTVTDPHMTRFVMTLGQSIDLVLFALTSGLPGEIYVRKAPAVTVEDIISTVMECFDYKEPVENIGVRPGEKKHESLISAEERQRVIDHKEYFSIIPEILGKSYADYYFRGEKGFELPVEGYTSANTERLSVAQFRELLLSLPEFKAEVDSFGA